MGDERFMPSCAITTPLASADQEAAFQALLWFAAILGVFAIGIAFLVWFRQNRRKRLDVFANSGLSLEDLRKHREEGRITQDEYECLKRIVLDGAGGNPRSE